jgi:hypothetical protein
MPALPTIDATLSRMAPEQLRRSLIDFLPKEASAEDRVRAIEVGLQSPMGQAWRAAMARWIVDEIVPLESLVPEAYLKWRPPVRDAMMFVGARASHRCVLPRSFSSNSNCR